MSEPQRLPNLYQLLGLNGLESSRDKIAAAIQRAQAKAESLKADKSRAADVARLQKVVALGQKYLLSAALKSSYDVQWSATYGDESNADAQPVAAAALTSAPSTAKPAPAVSKPAPEKVADELSWDMAALEALLPQADPLAPFQMADYLRTSEVRDPLAAEADLRKLIALLGGEELPATQPAVSQPISMQPLSPASFAGPSSLESHGANDQLTIPTEATTHESLDTGIVMSRPASSTAAVALAKRMRQKKQRAMLMGGVGLLAAVGGLVVLGLYLNRPAQPGAEVAQVPKPRGQVPPVTKPDNAVASNPDTIVALPPNTQLPNTPPPNNQLSGLIQPGGDVKPLEIQAPQMKPDAAMPEKPAEPMKPEAMKPDAAKPDAAKPDAPKPETPDPAKPDPAKPDPAKPDPAKPETAETPKPEAATDAKPEAPVKLTEKEKKAWQEQMKRVRAALAKLDPASSEKQIAELTPQAKTAEQKSQLATLEQAVGFIRKAREAMVAGIGGLESAETLKVGNTELAFVEGDETHVVFRNGGRRQEYRLDMMPAGIGTTLMRLEPNLVDAKLEAAIGVYIMVQAKAPGAKVAEGKKLLEDAAAAGAISKELAKFYEEDFKVQ